MTFVDDVQPPKLTRFSRVGFQIITCLTCGNKHAQPIDQKGADGELMTPWDIWPKGCPKCGGGKVDIDMVF